MTDRGDMVEKVADAFEATIIRYAVVGAEDHDFRVYDRHEGGKQMFEGARPQCIAWRQRQAARAAIAAMREPTRIVWQTLSDAISEDHPSDECWRKTIDSILKE